MNILIVDNHAEVLSAYEETLGNGKYNLLLAQNSSAALELIKSEPVDIVITAWDMPGMDGIELCRCIHQGGFKTNIYTILISDRETNSEYVQLR